MDTIMAELRDIVYLDRVRIESYLSQLAGGLTVQEAVSTQSGEDINAGFGANAGIVAISVGGKKMNATSVATTRMPAYAIVQMLESELVEEGLLKEDCCNLLPGQIVRVRGEMTLESWGLLASLADSAQGAGTLATKVYSKTKSNADLEDIRRELKALESAAKQKSGGQKLTRQEQQQRTAALAKRVGNVSMWRDIVTDGYIDDVKEIIKLFFQDQHHIRLAADETILVGLLREDGLVGSTMEELLFAYGTRPSTDFTILAQIAEVGRADPVNVTEIPARMNACIDPGDPIGTIQKIIREVGKVILQIAEELRRPSGEDMCFVVPLAMYREIRKPK
ncbi:DUF6414 family protein [Enhygromyxa salina]|uniref:DUF6414 family protein n=1 Tax=Enhygromyxa salina TaxID=215803 RepID=UPI000698E836|nr:hypothetical protein [Enhygromyxa salina]